MKYNILFIKPEHSCVQDIKDIKELGYDVVSVISLIDILYLIQRHSYAYVVIDLELDTDIDILLKNIRDISLKSTTPIIGIYDISCKNKRYNPLYFNNITTKPVIDWNNILIETRINALMISDISWEKYNKNEKLYMKAMAIKKYKIN